MSNQTVQLLNYKCKSFVELAPFKAPIFLTQEPRIRPSTRLPPMWPRFDSGLGVICGLSLLLVLVLAPRGFSPGTPVYPSPQKPTFPNSNSIWISVRDFIMSLWLGRLYKHSPCYFSPPCSRIPHLS